ncbi:MAG TPA: phage baseplate assembly protein V [Kofleriaceae bacterium]
MDLFDRIFSHENTERRERSIWGVLTAKVTGRMDDGRYELSYSGMGGNAPSAPARAMMSSAGDKRGNYFMPEVGDEVVVAFDSGDPNMPIILGSVWNGEAKPPEQAKPSAQNDIRTIVSRSGHEITFDDTSAKEQIKIKSKGGHELVLDDTPPGKITLSTKLGSKLEIDEATQSMTLRAPLAITIETAALALAAGAMTMKPPVPTPDMPAPPPGPTTLVAPLLLDITSPLIKIKAAAIMIETTGVQTTSTLVIDGRPWASVM